MERYEDHVWPVSGLRDPPRSFQRLLPSNRSRAEQSLIEIQIEIQLKARLNHFLEAQRKGKSR